jgi:hypothetical protein
MSTVTDGKNAPNNESKFQQQRMPAWQPLLSPGTVIPGFLLLGAGFIAVGSVIIAAQADLKSYGPVEYGASAECGAALMNSPCYQTQHNISYGPAVAYNALKALNPLCVPLEFADDGTPAHGEAGTNVCRFTITLTEDWAGPVYFFYTLTNFYQNHRLYVSDRADNQLSGENNPNFKTLFTDLKSDLPFQGCSDDVTPGAVYCTGTDPSAAWVPVSSEHTMGQTQSECEAGGSVPTAATGLTSAPAASGVWCPCAAGVWGECTAVQMSGQAVSYDNSKITWPSAGGSCEDTQGYTGYAQTIKQGGQCWAQFCNPCGRMARSFFTDKFQLVTTGATPTVVPWGAGQAMAGETGPNGKFGPTRTTVGELVDGSAPLLNVRNDALNSLVTSSDFLAWMRASILPR